ncbi:ATP-binding protein [Pararhizobium sp. DWP3-4]|uniref:ATP-binding protein n=1 Tax=Pararhizobium sp. DWP3-4 TaxID=2804565 RepID=UPI003CF16707
MENHEGIQHPNTLRFGPFTLHVTERRLERDGQAVPLGSRALDLLIVLTRRAQTVVTKDILMEEVWAGFTVDGCNLRYQVAALRRALADGVDGARYITTVPGRGYCFVAVARGANQGALPIDYSEGDNLPQSLDQIIGRDEDLAVVTAKLLSERFVSIVGTGGIGKTTVAVAVGHTLRYNFSDLVRFVELGSVSDPRLVTSVVATTLGLVVQTDNLLNNIVAAVRDKHILLIFDSCEHVVDMIAPLIETIHAQAPRAYILVTSRETLRVMGEHVHWLRPLATPAQDAILTASAAMRYPSIRLFAERVDAAEGRFVLSDEDAPIVATICRRLDGIALAIEFAAGRAGSYGVAMTAQLLERQFHLQWQGRRTARPRHQTLEAALDWSYMLLAETERLVLIRLSVFAGVFDLDAATAVAIDGDLADAAVLEAIASLISKSLITRVAGDSTRRYRLLDTTRVYLLKKLLSSDDATPARWRHASYLLRFFNSEKNAAARLTQGEAFARYGSSVNDARLALQWCLAEGGEPTIGAALAAAAAPILLLMALLTECNRWMEEAIASLNQEALGTRLEMELQAALGQSLMWTESSSERLFAANDRALSIAERIEGPEYRLWLIRGLHSYFQRIGSYNKALAYAESCLALSDQLGEEARHLALSLLGITRHSMGLNEQALRDLRASLALPEGSQSAKAVYFLLDYRNRARLALARSLWISGYTNEALRVSEQALSEAAELQHPVAICMSNGWTSSLFLWSGDLERAEHHIDLFWDMIQRHSFAGGEANWLGVKAVIAVATGREANAVDILRHCIDTLQREEYLFLLPNFEIALAEGLLATDRAEEALVSIDRALARTELCGDLLTRPEMLRVRGEILAEIPDVRASEVEASIKSALNLANAQGALVWELRAAISLVKVCDTTSGGVAARQILASVIDRFGEGFDQPDLVAARRILAAP